MKDNNTVIPEVQFKKLLKLLPTPKYKGTGRPRCSKEALLKGVLYVLKFGVPWYAIPEFGASPVSCWRYFMEIQRRGKLKLILEALSDEKTDPEEGSIDSSTATSYRFRRGVGWDGKHKKNGTKVSLFTDKVGLPVDVIFGKANKHDLKFVDKHIKNTAGKRRKVINLDKGYTSADMRRELSKKKIKINMEIRKGDYKRKRGPKFKFDKELYKCRFAIERTFAWTKSFNRIRTRKDRSFAMFKAFVYLALIIILIRN